MAGRGRGRGKPTMSISNEQLGITKESQPPQVAHPPPNFPPLVYKPIIFNITDELSYLFELKRDFAEFMKESIYNVEPVIIKKDIDRYSDHYADTITNYESRYDWTRMPAELKPLTKKRKCVDGGNVSLNKKKDINIEEKLKELEKKENNHISDVEEDLKEEEDKEEKDPDEIIEDEEEDMDEEMDDGTDYVNNYFDNGEGYDEEEDNIDDGPVY